MFYPGRHIPVPACKPWRRFRRVGADARLAAYYYGLYIYELPYSEMGKLPAETRFLNATEGKARIGLYDSVYSEKSGSNFPGKSLRGLR
jgi:hypothetical protein